LSVVGGQSSVVDGQWQCSVMREAWCVVRAPCYVN
jgi:hypothetical protein